MNDQDLWRELGQQLRVDSIRSSSAAGSGHPTSSMSAADLMAVLMAKYLHYDFGAPDDPRNDHLIFSKGHASPLVYAIYKAAGAISDEEMLTFRKLGSRIEGHPTPVLPWVDVATGSLGQGLPISVGVAYAGKYLDRLPYRVWCLCGDSEMAEGSMWEAFESAAFHGLDNLTAIIDVNRLGQTGETMHGWDLDAYARRARAFGWHTVELDGHDVVAIDGALTEALAMTDRPTVLIAKTEKGHGVAAVANKNGFHGKPLADPEAAIEELGGERNLQIKVPRPEGSSKPHAFETSGDLQLPAYEPGTKEATRKAYGDTLVALGNARGDVVALDGEVGNSTYSEEFAQAHPDRFIQNYIAEQQMVAMAVGLQVRGWRPFAGTFAAFLARAYDFVRMAAVSRADIVLVGSHAGVSIGEDGPSQMALEDIASFRAIHSSTVLHPSDANQTSKLVEAMADLEGIVFLRTLRGKTEVRTPADEDVRVGGSRVAAGADADERPRVLKLAVREMPTSGSPEELLHEARIDAEA
ncbi:MAG TPA: transketolase, partial [Candidatus Binatia bacterium]|nr:transketolase [Candidatus Binatia bacterium]